MERVLKVAILRRGLPKAIYVDNGAVYSATQFGVACATLGVHRIHSTPYEPEGGGKQERFFETVRLQFLPEVEASQITTLTELNESFWAQLECVYHVRVHSETEQTPLARFTAGLEQVRTVDPETLGRAFLWREQRRVTKTATLSLQGNRYQVDPRFAGRTLGLRFDPFDLSHVELYLEGQPQGVATVLEQGRQRHLAVQRLATDPPDPPRPKSSLDYLAALRAEHQAQQQKELAARLTYLVRERGFGLVTGEIGSGKSTAVRAFSASLDPNRYLVPYLANPTTGITGAFRDLLLGLGHEPPFSRPRLVARLREAFTDLLNAKRRVPIVIMDEAHLLTQPMLEQLRLLFSDQMDSQSLATVVLVGHPDLRRTLHLAVHEALSQRLAVRCHLGPLDLAETVGYVRHHVGTAGYTTGPLFTDDAIARIFEYTKGLPRRINQVCTTALMAGLIDQKQLLDETTIRKAIAELDHT